MSNKLPFLITEDPEQPIAYRHGRAVLARELVGDVYAIAQLLPEQTFLLNACRDRYHFVVGMGAALLRGQVCVLPHNHSADTVSMLRDRFGDLLCLIDDDNPFEGLSSLAFPHKLTGSSQWPPPEFDANQLAACLFTSGSTGEPARFDRTWGAIADSARAAAAGLGLRPQDQWRVLATVPSQHSYGFESAIFLPLLTNGLFDAGQPFYPADVVAALGQLDRPRLLVTTPVHLRSIVESTGAKVEADMILSATAPLSHSLAQAAETFFSAPVFEIYGSTESGQTATRRTVDGDLWTPMDGVRIVQDGDRFFARCHVGERVELSDNLGLEADGRFRLLGRKADMVIVAGKRGSKAFLEAQLCAIDGIHDAAILISEDGGESARVVGFVIAPGHTRRTVIQALKRSVEPAFLPRPLYFVDRLPRESTGKLSRQALQALTIELDAKVGHAQ